MAIPFTQYLRPDGRRRLQTIERPEAIEQLANVVIAAGASFACEELCTGQASITCEFQDQDIAIEICENGPPIEAAVDSVVQAAYRYLTGLEPPAPETLN